VTRLITPPKPTAWQAATVVSIRDETPRVKTIRFAVPDWPGHLAGQHADVRLTAEDGYRAERSYSIASAPDAPGPELTVERLEEGEVSPFLTGELEAGDAIELRGPIGGHFIWSAAEARRPLLLVGGGCGVVPLMCMLRHRRLSGSSVPAALLYSCRTREDVIYHSELGEIARGDPRFALQITLTRERPTAWSGPFGRIDLPMIKALVERLGGMADCFVCGRDGFVEAASVLLMQAGQPAEIIRTERFGATGPLPH
jgi:ferredoxin-NADP reductase